MFTTVDSLESYKWNLHCQECAHYIKSTIGHMCSGGPSIGHKQVDIENWDYIYDEGVPSPTCHHIEIRY
jgi:hypothetical protein